MDKKYYTINILLSTLYKRKSDRVGEPNKHGPEKLGFNSQSWTWCHPKSIPAFKPFSQIISFSGAMPYNATKCACQ